MGGKAILRDGDPGKGVEHSQGHSKNEKGPSPTG